MFSAKYVLCWLSLNYKVPGMPEFITCFLSDFNFNNFE